MIKRDDAEHIRESLQKQMNLLAEQLAVNDGLTEMILRMGRKAHATKPLHPDPRLQPVSSTGDCEVAVESLCHYVTLYRAKLHNCLRYMWADIVTNIMRLEDDEEPSMGLALRVIDLEDALGNFDIPEYARPNPNSNFGKRAIAYVDRVRRARRGEMIKC